MIYKYPNKDKFVKIYEITRKRLPNDDNTFVEKKYLHPENKPLRAYVRQLSASERISKSTEKEMNSYEIIINYRPGVRSGQFIELKGMTLRINGVDGYELYEAELKLIASSDIPPEAYDKVTDTEYQIK